MSEIKTVPITLITGYLGSGKTTLVNHILRNAKNHKMAVIVNDLGEVNIDAELIEKEGVVSGKDDNLVALQNGCICCTLKKDLIEQLADLVQSQKFDHIIIEASGICEPVPIAQTIAYMEEEFEKRKLPKYYNLDAIVSVTDVLRLRDEFGCGEVFNSTKRGEEDLENLVIQQIEFCDVVILNKVSDISKEELSRVEKVIRAIQPKAKIVHADYCKVDINQIVDTHLFNFMEASGSAAWIREFEDWDNEIDSDEMHEHHHDDDDDDDDEDEHEHEHHHHHHDHDHDHDEDEHEHEHHHHDHDDDDDEDEHEHHHGHDHEHGHDHHHHTPGEHDADEVFENVGVETARRFTQDEIRGMTDALSDQEEYGLILRAKGILQSPEGDWFQFDWVPGELQLRPSSPDYAGRLVVIGTNIDEKALKALFQL